jgi:hypothetical protein
MMPRTVLKWNKTATLPYLVQMTDDGTNRMRTGRSWAPSLGICAPALSVLPRKPVGSGCHQPAGGYDPLGLRCFELRSFRLSELRVVITPEPSRKAGVGETWRENPATILMIVHVKRALSSRIQTRQSVCGRTRRSPQFKLPFMRAGDGATCAWHAAFSSPP